MPSTAKPARVACSTVVIAAAVALTSALPGASYAASRPATKPAPTSVTTLVVGGGVLGPVPTCQETWKWKGVPCPW